MATRMTRAERSEQTRTELIVAARTVFLRRGFHGASLDEISAEAGYTTGAVYSRFGGKDDLFLAVLEAAYARIREAEKTLSLLDVPADEGVRRLVRFTWQYYLENPEFLTLLNSENLHRAEHLRRSREVRAMNSPLIETLAQVLRRGHREGLFRAGVDPLQLYISIAALSYFYLGNNHTLSAVFGRDLTTAAARDERLAHMVDVIMGYLRPAVDARRGRPR